MSRTIPPQLRRQVWEAHMKKPRCTYGPCYVCSGEIHILQFECGHVVSHHHGGDLTVKNLRPICGSCNKSMGTQDLEEYKRTFYLPGKNKVQRKESNSFWGWFKTDPLDGLAETMNKLTLNPTGCQHQLMKGQRKGQSCGKKISKGSYCSTHFNYHQSK